MESGVVFSSPGDWATPEVQGKARSVIQGSSIQQIFDTKAEESPRCLCCPLGRLCVTGGSEASLHTSGPQQVRLSCVTPDSSLSVRISCRASGNVRIVTRSPVWRSVVLCSVWHSQNMFWYWAEKKIQSSWLDVWD